jgi:hypothetical protein
MPRDFSPTLVHPNGFWHCADTERENAANKTSNQVFFINLLPSIVQDQFFICVCNLAWKVKSYPLCILESSRGFIKFSFGEIHLPEKTNSDNVTDPLRIELSQSFSVS